ncbi:hypothetical protein VZO05_00805 [Aggregatilineales bacterium SYSU G02658]
MNVINDHYEKWNRFAPLALLIVGIGVSIIGDATIGKARGKRGWVLKGTLGLIVLNAGLSIFGEAVKSRALYEAELNARLKDQKLNL